MLTALSLVKKQLLIIDNQKQNGGATRESSHSRSSMRNITHTHPALILFFLSLPTFAQCVNSVKPSCNVYSSCFEKNCDCTGSEDEYLSSFGLNYCKAFLGEHSFSAAGQSWRDSTLRCLQEAIVPLIPLEQGRACDCSKIKNFAYSSHVSCYTQPLTSVCDLPISDISLIAKTIIFDKNFISLLKDRKNGYAQVKEVLEVCSTTAKEAETKNKWKFYLKLIRGKVE